MLCYLYIHPLIIAFFNASYYIKKLEIHSGTYNKYTNEDFPPPDTALEGPGYDYELDKDFESFNGACQYSAELLYTLHRIIKRGKKPRNMKLIEEVKMLKCLI